MKTIPYIIAMMILGAIAVDIAGWDGVFLACAGFAIGLSQAIFSEK